MIKSIILLIFITIVVLPFVSSQCTQLGVCPTAGSACLNDKYCAVGSTCEHNNGVHTCQETQKCVDTDDISKDTCPIDKVCRGGLCQFIRIQYIGGVCKSDADCFGNSCIKNVCTKKTDSLCYIELQCLGSEICLSNHTCTLKFEDGSACTYGSECINGACMSGKCAHRFTGVANDTCPPTDEPQNLLCGLGLTCLYDFALATYKCKPHTTSTATCLSTSYCKDYESCMCESVYKNDTSLPPGNGLCVPSLNYTQTCIDATNALLECTRNNNASGNAFKTDILAFRHCSTELCSYKNGCFNEIYESTTCFNDNILLCPSDYYTPPPPPQTTSSTTTSSTTTTSTTTSSTTSEPTTSQSTTGQNPTTSSQETTTSSSENPATSSQDTTTSSSQDTTTSSSQGTTTSSNENPTSTTGKTSTTSSTTTTISSSTTTSTTRKPTDSEDGSDPSTSSVLSNSKSVLLLLLVAATIF